MEAIETEICQQPGKRDNKGRRMLGSGEWYRLMADYDASGLTQAKFCEREGVNYHTFVAWLGRRNKSNASEAPAAEGSRKFQEFSLGTALTGGANLEVVLSDGTTVRGANIQELVQLVRLLQE